MRPNALVGHSVHHIHIGDVFASRESTAVRTVLGSCIAVCLRDPLTQIGGMNHFMLPIGHGLEQDNARYGVHAMEMLINACMKLGADRRRMEAKVFGGGHVLRMKNSQGSVPRSNIRFALRFLEMEDIPIRSRDLGGYAAREIYFVTGSGRTLLKRLPCTGDACMDVLTAIQREERIGLRKIVEAVRANDDSNITLF